MSVTSVCVCCCRISAGLRHVIYHYSTCRHDVYKRLYQIMWFGGKVGKAAADAASRPSPTYVFLPNLVAEVRQRFPVGDVGTHDHQYQAGSPGVHVFTWEEIKDVSWPSPPKHCNLCSCARPKP